MIFGQIEFYFQLFLCKTMWIGRYWVLIIGLMVYKAQIEGTRGGYFPVK